jgi:hypothetical protein
MKSINDRPNGMRWCSICCGVFPKTEEYFYLCKSGSNAGLFHGQCKQCQSARNRTPEARAKGQERRKRKGSLWKRDRNKRLESKLKSDYGITLAIYNRLLFQQQGVCKICKGLNRNGNRLGVDHDATTGVVRGLLCFPCNIAIGYLQHEPDRLEAARDYLLNHANIQPTAKEA